MLFLLLLLLWWSLLYVVVLLLVLFTPLRGSRTLVLSELGKIDAWLKGSEGAKPRGSVLTILVTLPPTGLTKKFKNSTPRQQLGD